MRKVEVYKELETVPGTTNYIIAPGRQFSIGHNLAMAQNQSYGLSPMSQLNVIAGAMIHYATKGQLVVTGNEKAGFTKGAAMLLASQFPEINPFYDTESPTTLASAINLSTLFKEIICNSGIVDIVITSDEPQANRLADMFRDRDVPVRGIAVAHRIVAQSQSPECQDLVKSYRYDKWRYLESAKQIGLRLIDPHGTRLESLAQNARP